MTVIVPDQSAAPAAAQDISARNEEEYQYLDLVKDIIEEGELRRDR